MGQVILREITKCNDDQKNKVREVRNSESVKRFMYTDHTIGLAEHLAWIDSLRDDRRQIVFVVFWKNNVSGVASINALDRIHKKSDWAYYLDDKARGGLGAALEFAFLNYAFDTLGLEKLNCEVIENNSAVVKLHLKFGFVEEGFRRSNIIKNGARIGVHFLGLLREDWVVKRVELGLSYKSIFDKFPVSIEPPAFSS
jgi:UDP-4-amino-4,6-dideoxy-N-acetyl-beta-L-altrosamine N-acetyltransferase